MGLSSEFGSILRGVILILLKLGKSGSMST